jgi:hypothetical protein
MVKIRHLVVGRLGGYSSDTLSEFGVGQSYFHSNNPSLMRLINIYSR